MAMPSSPQHEMQSRNYKLVHSTNVIIASIIIESVVLLISVVFLMVAVARVSMAPTCTVPGTR